MNRPPFGICQACTVVQVVDGDTLAVTISGAYEWRVRLLDCWAPESRGPKKSEAGVKAKEFCKSLVEDAQAHNSPFALFVPFDWHRNEHDQQEQQDLTSILKATTLGRVVGIIWIGEKTLNDLMVQSGHATREKPKA